MCYFSLELWLVIMTGIDMAGFRVAIFNIWVVCCSVTMLHYFQYFMCVWGLFYRHSRANGWEGRDGNCTEQQLWGLQTELT